MTDADPYTEQLDRQYGQSFFITKAGLPVASYRPTFVGRLAGKALKVLGLTTLGERLIRGRFSHYYDPAYEMKRLREAVTKTMERQAAQSLYAQRPDQPST